MMHEEESGRPVEVPDLGITGEDLVGKAVALFRKMLCFDADKRCWISDVCKSIEKLISK